MTLILHALILLLVFYLLAIICDRYFVNSLDRIAVKLKMNSDMAGATLMAVGTSAPELFVSLIAVFKPGEEALGAGTIVGSAIFNILVIIGAIAIVRKAFVAWQPIIRDVLFYSLSIILLIASFWDGKIILMEAILFVLLYLIYVLAVLKWKKILPYQEEIKSTDKDEHLEKHKQQAQSIWQKINSLTINILDYIFPNPKKYWRDFFFSIIMIAALSWVLVESAVKIAQILNVPSVIIGLTILAAGTSIPDLMSSIIVAKQKRGGMGISNAIGSNIFDILIGLGLPWLIITTSGHIVPVVTENLSHSIILLFATVISILAFLIAKKWHIGRFAGFSLITLYLIYLSWNILQVI